MRIEKGSQSELYHGTDLYPLNNVSCYSTGNCRTPRVIFFDCFHLTGFFSQNRDMHCLAFCGDYDTFKKKGV